MRNTKRASSKSVIDTSKSLVVPQDQECYEGERLARLLTLIRGGIESAKIVNNHSLPDKFWLKQQFAIGVNEVTRVLERMKPAQEPSSTNFISAPSRKLTSIQLQAILMASDSNPKWLTKHLPSLALSRKVPVIFVRDKKGGSLRLGELVKLKTAMALGIKAKGSSINQIIEQILCGSEIVNSEPQDRLPELV